MTEQIKGWPFDLEAAKNGAEILCNEQPCKFIAHIPENHPEWRVVVAHAGYARSFTEDGRFNEGERVLLTMAPRTVKKVGYRDYYAQIDERILKLSLRESNVRHIPTSVECSEGFIHWIHTEWQYDEVEIP
jgi:hypothetical protein